MFRKSLLIIIKVKAKTFLLQPMLNACTYTNILNNYPIQNNN